MNSTQLAGHSVIVTGGTRGIGWEIALALISAGANVVVTGRSEADRRKITAACGYRRERRTAPRRSLPMFASCTTACAWRMRQLIGLVASLE